MSKAKKKLNLSNRTIFCNDNLEVLQGINNECIDLIYLDPPFNKNKKFTAPVGSSAEGASFSDIFREEDIKDEWVESIEYENADLYAYLAGVRSFSNQYNYCYLVYMTVRLLECYRVLKPTGSIYLHCDPTMSYHLRIVLDCIFGESNFRSEIIWRRLKSAGGRGLRRFANNADHILYYAKSDDFIWNQQYMAHDPVYVEKQYRHKDADGRRYRLGDLTGREIRSGSSGKPWRGIDPSETGNHWAVPNQALPKSAHNLTSQEKLDILDKMGRIYWPKRGRIPAYKRYLDEMPGTAVDTIWNDIGVIQYRSLERTGYPTQKPLALLERIIKASSNEGDVVLDPFCGCATTCVAAEKLSRQWIGIDVSHKAYELVKERLKREVQGVLPSGQASLLDYDKEVVFRTSPPKRTDTNGHVPDEGNVYIISNPKWPGEYKVGIAKDVKSRLNSYQTSDPDRAYKVEFVHSSPHFKKIEKHTHDAFDSKGEWVSGELEELRDAIVNYKPE